MEKEHRGKGCRRKLFVVHGCCTHEFIASVIIYLKTCTRYASTNSSMDQGEGPKAHAHLKSYWKLIAGEE